MVDFRGQVQVSEVQEAFNDLVNNINNIVDSYNSVEANLGLDLSVGASYLAPTGYALSIGGLKKILQAYNGATVGCHIWRLDSTHLLITNGIHLTADGGTKLPQAVIEFTGNPKYLYFNTTNNTYIVSDTEQTSDSYIFIRNINTKRNIKLCDTSSNYAIQTKLKTFCGNNAVNQNDNNYDDSYRPCFVCANNIGVAHDRYIYFLGTPIAHDYRTTQTNHKQVFPYPHFFLPENVSNPFTGDIMAMKSFAYIEKK